jgi:hypothetical protein
MSGSQKGGIDQVRTINKTLAFDQTHDRFRVFVPNVDSGELKDLALSLNGGLNPYFTLSGGLFLWPDSVQLSIVGQLGSTAYSQDITSPLLKEMRRLIDLQDRHAVMEAYAAGMADWLRHVETYFTNGTMGYTRAVLDRDRALAKSLVEVNAASELLDQMGNRSCGFGGSLHIFNYLYTYVPLSPVSIGKFLDDKTNLSQFSAIGIGCKQTVGETGISHLSGAVSVGIEATIHNPLREQLADLQTTISSRLVEIDKKLQGNGLIMQSLADAHDQLTVLKDTIGTFETHLTSSLAELNQLKMSIAGLDHKIDVTGLVAPPRPKIFPG